MTDEIISITKTKFYDAPDWFEAYKIITNRLNHINDHIIVYIVYSDPDYGWYYLTDDGYTVDEIYMWGIRIDEEFDMILEYVLGDDFEYIDTDGSYEIVSGEIYIDDDFGDELTNFLDTIEAVYKEFLGQEERQNDR